MFSTEKRDNTVIARGEFDLAFLVIVMILVCLGLVMLFSASYANAYYYMDDSLHYISRQLVYAVIGVVGMFVVSKIDYRILRPFAVPIYFVTLVLLVIVLFCPPINNARRWIPLVITTFQPSEVAKFSVALLFAAYIAKYSKTMNTFKHGVMPFVFAMLPIVALMYFQPHLSGIVIICGIGAVLMFAGGTSLIWFILGGGVATVAAVAIINIPALSSYAGSRFTVWLDPFIDTQGAGYQTIQSLYAIASGGLTGMGIGESRQKFLFLPEPHNDFIFSVICEELGFIGAVLIIVLFVLLISRGFIVALRCPDRFGCLLCIGLTAQVGIQALLNIAVVTNTLPNTGISLPFFSYGGTSLIMLLAQMGIILSISRHSIMEKR